PVDPDLDVDEVECLVAPEVRPVEQEHRVLEEEGDAERTDEGRDARRPAERPIGEALDRDAEEPAPDHRAEDHHDDKEPDGDARIARPAEPADDPPADARST